MAVVPAEILIQRLKLEGLYLNYRLHTRTSFLSTRREDIVSAGETFHQSTVSQASRSPQSQSHPENKAWYHGLGILTPTQTEIGNTKTVPLFF